jgi:hypothetical protein
MEENKFIELESRVVVRKTGWRKEDELLFNTYRISLRRRKSSGNGELRWLRNNVRYLSLVNYTLKKAKIVSFMFFIFAIIKKKHPNTTETNFECLCFLLM